MKRLIFFLVFSSYSLSVDISENSFSMSNEALSKEIENSYLDWKNKYNITPSKEASLSYLLTITGPDISESYTISGSDMQQIKKLLDRARISKDPNQWYVVQIDSQYDNNYGIDENTIALVALTLDQVESLATIVQQLKSDLDATKDDNSD